MVTEHSGGDVRSWRARFEGSFLEELKDGLAATDFGNRIVLIGAALLLAVMPMVILLSGFASTRVDDDIARHLGLGRQGTVIIERLIKPQHGVTLNLAI